MKFIKSNNSFGPDIPSYTDGTLIEHDPQVNTKDKIYSSLKNAIISRHRCHITILTFQSYALHSQVPSVFGGGKSDLTGHMPAVYL